MLEEANLEEVPLGADTVEETSIETSPHFFNIQQPRYLYIGVFLVLSSQGRFMSMFVKEGFQVSDSGKLRSSDLE